MCVLSEVAVDRRTAWMSVMPVKVEIAQESEVTQQHSAQVIGVMIRGVSQPFVSRATTEVALTQQYPVMVTGM